MNNWLPNWKYESQVEGEERKRSSHVLISNQEVTELTWENGQLAMHELSGLISNKPTWNRSSDTLESIVHQATSSHNNSRSGMLLSHHSDQFNHINASSNLSDFSFEKSVENSKSRDGVSRIVKKRMRLEPDQCSGNLESSFAGGLASASAAGGSATCSRENDLRTMMTWTSLEGDTPSLKVNTTNEDPSCHQGSENMDREERVPKGETSRSNSMRHNRAAENHNQSERRRRDRINQKLKALQRLVPNARKNDKASMLDEVITYLKQLQAQVKMMNTKSLPQMMPALAMQQQMQIALLGRMGMGMGVGLGMGHNVAQSLPQDYQILTSPTQIDSATNSSFFSPSFAMPPMIPNHSPNATMINNMAAFNNPYSHFLTQPMNMDLYNKMAAIYQQHLNQTNQPTSNPLPHNNVQGG